MKRKRHIVSVIAFLLVLPILVMADGLQVGTAAVDITPPPGMPFHVPERPPYPVISAEGTHDPLHAKAVVFANNGVKAAIVACGLTSIPLAIIQEARAQVGKICDVPPENVMITALHTHTTPLIRPRFYRNHASPAQLKVAHAYLAQLPGLIAESVKQADAKLTPVKMSAALGKVEGVAHNRRYLMKDGQVTMNPGKNDPSDMANVGREAGPTDPGLPLVYFDTAAGKPIASMINFSMHLDTTGGLKYSEDFPYEISKILAAVKGPEMMTHFTTGACGDINHYYLTDPKHIHRVKGYGEAARIGSLLAAEVVRCYQRLQPQDAGPLKVSHEILQLKMMPSKSKKFEALHHGKPFFDGEVTETFVDGNYTFPAEVMVITIGDEVAFVSVPGELFVTLGLEVKLNSPYQYTFLDELANGAIGYIPTRVAEAEGGYGASPLSSRCAPDSGEMLVASAIRQLIAHRDFKPTLR